MNVISLLVIGDEAISRAGMRYLLMSEPGFEVRGEATNKDAVEQASKLSPDVVILVAEAARSSCALLIGSIRKHVPRTGIVVLVRETHDTYLGMLLSAGALGYVLLGAATKEVLSAIRAASRGRRFICPGLSDKLIDVLARKASTGTKLLSRREEQVLSMTAYGYSLIEIASYLGISRKSIETYRARIREKLGLHTRSEIVRYALDIGIFNAETQRTAQSRPNA